MPTEKTFRRTPGRPRKYGQGRINATVRFTPEIAAELRAEADQQGRSFSEQVEHIVERAISERKLVANLRRELETAHDDRVKDVEAVTTTAVEQMEQLKTMYAAQEERLAEIVEAAVKRALKGTNR